MKIIIVGSGSAALTAAYSAQMANPEAGITLISEEGEHPYRKPAIVKLIQGVIHDPLDLSHGYLQASGDQFTFKETFNPNALSKIEVRLQTKATFVDPEKKIVKVQSMKDGKQKSLSYSSLVLATGATAFIPPIEGSQLKGCFANWTMKQAVDITKYAAQAKKALIVGGGFTGLESAENLIHRGLKTSIVEQYNLLWAMVEPDISDLIAHRLTNQGINVYSNHKKLRILGKNKVEGFALNGKSNPADLVIFATGARPNVDLIQDYNPEMNGRSLSINEKMETSLPNIYAAGNVADYFDFTLQKRMYLPVARLAAYQGRIAGINAAGKSARDIGFLKAQIDQVMGLQIAGLGHNSITLKNHNISARVEDWSDQFKHFEGDNAIVKLLIGNKDKILGAQVIRSKYAGVIAAPLFQAMKRNLPVSEIELPEKTQPMATRLLTKKQVFYDLVRKTRFTNME
ncbi:MAG: NAD(P)/FAD-dependent oxidoreductase [Candidatus Ranarchaeia archaeon]